MLELQQNNARFIFNYSTPFAQQTRFFDPHFWQEQQRIIGSAQGRGTTWFIQSQDLFGMNCALRHYYRGGLWGKLNKDRYVFDKLENTRSFAEFALLNRLHQAGLPVPKPLAAKIELCGFGCYRADILTEKIENAQDLTALLQTAALTESAWQQIGKLIRRLHDLQICHTDLNAHNILVQHFGTPAEKYWLLDFDKCGEKSGENWKAENLQRLHRSFQKEIGRMHIRFEDENWRQLLAAYQA
ncbi:3-deoxy-D-manno-octulosonic acid kinase [Caviibacterium pharyngocola]|uniref:3-deoxy-D-manno-octulosonic acid kinase n=1 Tax=Caviibacterium pharyngocola TaxID=28159 RepID=A0A2M8RTY7_9PAST|nr:3-deoxy-D-manno-octulosonic acid kinase [Caviibacterium pharyngocola]PJG82346.1 3-deoxy-D-manno-octulosonic acid kinase [Caviibacterium pharyngocola]